MEQKVMLEPASGGGEPTVRVSGDIGIESADQLRQMLLTALAGQKTVALNIEALTSLDLTVIQVICAACRTAAKNRAELKVAGALPECLRNYRSSIGVAMGSLCIQNNGQSCSWFGGEI